MSLKQQLISSKLLIHPGITLQEYLKELNISEEELSKKTSVSENHILGVIDGSKKISKEFSLKLEDALGIPANFWQNLQRNYDIEKSELN